MRNFHPGKHRSQGLGLASLTDDELYDIHLATLEVLEKSGLFIETDEALKVFDGAGAVVDRQQKIVKIPPYLVEDAIRSAPSKILLAGRDPKHDKVLEAGRVHFTNFSEGIEVVDPYNGQRRPPVKADLANAAKLVDYLDEIDVCEKAVGSSDVPQATLPLHNAQAMLANTTKHCCVGPGNGFLLKKLVQMAGTFAGGIKNFCERPILSFTTCPVSPLKLIDECCDIIMAAARSGSVINILSMAMAGGTSPVTLAGTPIQIDRAGTDLVTTAPAPTTTPDSRVTPPNTVTLAPSHTLSWILTPPSSFIPWLLMGISNLSVLYVPPPMTRQRWPMTTSLPTDTGHPFVDCSIACALIPVSRPTDIVPFLQESMTLLERITLSSSTMA